MGEEEEVRLLRKGTSRENEAAAEESGELRDWVVDRFSTVSLLSMGEEEEEGRLKDLAAGRFSATAVKQLPLPLPPSSPLSPGWFS